MFHFSAPTGSSFGHLIENLKFQMHEDQSALTIPAIGVLLGSINNTAVRSCRFEGGSTVDANAVGVVFSAPNNQASYSNTVMDCNFVNLGVGVRYEKYANQNNIFAGEFIQCLTGVDAAPPDGVVDTPKIFGSRIEGCGTGLRECAHQGMYFGVRFEDNGIDVDFVRYETAPGVFRVPTDTHFFGGSTAVSNPCFNNPQYVSGLVCLAPELSGNVLRSNSASRPNQLIGPNVFAPLGDAGTTVHPPGSGAAAAYFRGGRVVLDNQQWLVGRNQAGTGIVFGMSVNASDVLQMGASGKVDIGNTDGDHRTRVFKPCFLTSGSATGGSIVNKFPVYNASGSLIGYVPIYSS